MKARFRGVVSGMAALFLVVGIAMAHTDGRHEDHTHHESPSAGVYHEHWWGACYKHVTYTHVDYVHHIDANGNLVQHQYVGPTGNHLHEEYVSWWGNCG